MQIETVDDILEEVADRLELYGGCKSEDNGCTECTCDNVNFPFCCRTGFMGEYVKRFDDAVENERKLKGFLDD